MKIEFCDRDYRLSHGRAPRGRGGWAFSISGEGDAIYWAPSGSLAESKAWMRAKVRALVAEAGASPAHVLVTVCT